MCQFVNASGDFREREFHPTIGPRDDALQRQLAFEEAVIILSRLLLGVIRPVKRKTACLSPTMAQPHHQSYQARTIDVSRWPLKHQVIFSYRLRFIAVIKLPSIQKRDILWRLSGSAQARCKTYRLLSNSVVLWYRFYDPVSQIRAAWSWRKSINNPVNAQFGQSNHVIDVLVSVASYIASVWASEH